MQGSRGDLQPVQWDGAGTIGGQLEVLGLRPISVSASSTVRAVVQMVCCLPSMRTVNSRPRFRAIREPSEIPTAPAGASVSCESTRSPAAASAPSTEPAKVVTCWVRPSTEMMTVLVRAATVPPPTVKAQTSAAAPTRAGLRKRCVLEVVAAAGTTAVTGASTAGTGETDVVESTVGRAWSCSSTAA